MQADELSDSEWRDMRIWPGERYPELPYFDEDWFRFYYKGERFNVVAYEVHEMGCTSNSCAFRPSLPCPWHPIGCECSEGQCQED